MTYYAREEDRFVVICLFPTQYVSGLSKKSNQNSIKPIATGLIH